MGGESAHMGGPGPWPAFTDEPLQLFKDVCTATTHRNAEVAKHAVTVAVAVAVAVAGSRGAQAGTVAGRHVLVGSSARVSRGPAGSQP